MNIRGKQIHWGVGLLVGCGVFVAGILTMVFISMSREVDLVTDGYYEKELQYQERIHAIQRGAYQGNAITVTESGAQLVLQFPRHRLPGMYSGTILFYRPASVHDDFRIAVAPDSACRQVIPTSRLARGLWRLKMEWVAESETCYAEKIVVLQ